MTQSVVSLVPHSVAERARMTPIIKRAHVPAHTPSLLPTNLQTIGIPRIRHKSWRSTISIGLIDTGVDATHTDLIDCLGTGFNAFHPHHPPNDTHGHGTHIAGTIAASGRLSIQGIAPRAIVHPIKAFDTDGQAHIGHIIDAIAWCLEQRVRIINMSFGTLDPNDQLSTWIQRATNAGAIIVASAGNDGKKQLHYPARYTQTISVGALTRQNSIATFSNQAGNIDVFAPGEHIVSTWPGNRLATLSGTSMATAHVTGVIALLLARHPHLSPTHVRATLRRLPHKRLYAPTLFRAATSLSVPLHR